LSDKFNKIHNGLTIVATANDELKKTIIMVGSSGYINRLALPANALASIYKLG
jgi:hypothetical protein